MTAYRFARPEEEDQLLDLIDLVFSKTGQPHDFASLLPKVYGRAGFHALHAVAEKDGRLIGTIAMLPTDVWMGAEKLRGGYIGSVAVHGRFRGQGHMKALMALLIEEAKRRDYDFLALGGQRQRYGHWGFETCGTDIRFSVNRMNARHALGDENAAFTFCAPRDEHWDAIKAMHDRLPFHCERERALLADILQSYGSEPLSILDEAGGLAGYLVRMGNEITELCLEDETQLRAVVKCLMRDEKKLIFHVPGCLPERLRSLHAFAEETVIGDREMLLPLRWERLLQAGLRLRSEIENARGAALPDGERVVRIENEGAFLFKVEEGNSLVTKTQSAPDISFSAPQAVDSLFSPAGARLLPDPLLSAWLPLPWGLDCADTF